MAKIISLVLALAALVVFWRVVPHTSLADEAHAVKHPYSATIVEQTGASRELLDEDNRELYDVLKTGILSFENEIKVRRFAYNEQDIQDVMWYIMNDSPEIFWIDWSWDVRSENDGFSVIPTYIFTADEVKVKQNELNSTIAEIVSEAGELTADYDKALYVHDWLVRNCDYTDNADDPVTHTSYSALVTRSSVCDGYAQAARMLLDKLGVESLYCEGTATNEGKEEGHAWNIVKIDGEYHHMDATWDDPNYRNDEYAASIVSHTYFLLGDEGIAVDHTIDNRVKLPKCSDYGYFKKLGLSGTLFEDISDEVTSELYKNVAAGSSYIEFQIADEADYKKVSTEAESVGKVIDAINTKLKEAKSDKKLSNTFSFFRRADHQTLLVIFSLS